MLGFDMDRVADALQEIKPESSWFQTRPESDRYKTNFSIESIATGIDVDFKDATAKTQGAFDYTMGFLTQRVHKEWEPTIHTTPTVECIFHRRRCGNNNKGKGRCLCGYVGGLDCGSGGGCIWTGR